MTGRGVTCCEHTWHPVNTFTHGWRWMCVVERRRWVADVRGAPDGWDYRPVSRTVSDPIMKHEEALSLLHSQGLTDKEIAAVVSAILATKGQE